MHLLPLADIDLNAIFGAIILIATVISVIFGGAKEAKEAKRRRRQGGAAAIDSRIRHRQRQRREQVEEARVAEDAVPVELVGVELSDEDREAIAAARRREADELEREQRRRAQQLREEQAAARERREAEEGRRRRALQDAAAPQGRRESASRSAVARNEIGAGGGEIGSHPRAVATRANPKAKRMRQLLRQQGSMKTVILASEVLGKPVALRDG